MAKVSGGTRSKMPKGNYIYNHKSNLSVDDSIKYIGELTGDKTNAIHMYNAIKAYTGLYYKAMIDGQKGGKQDYNIQEYNRELDRFIRLSPKFKGTVYRGIYLSDENPIEYEVGTIISDKTVRSWTTDSDITFRYMGFSPDTKRNIMFRSTGVQNGTSVNFASTNGLNKELIMGRNSQYKITKVTHMDGYTLVDVKPISNGKVKKE